MQIQVCYDKAKYFMHNKTTVHIFFASFIASMTSRAIFLTSFCQAGRESSAIACHIVNINTIILYVCYQFKMRMRFTRQKKMPHILDKARFKQYKYPTSANTRLANDWWCSWMWGLAAPWFLKRHVHEFVRSSGWGRCAAITPGEPAPAWHIAGRYSKIPRDLKLCPRG